MTKQENRKINNRTIDKIEMDKTKLIKETRIEDYGKFASNGN